MKHSYPAAAVTVTVIVCSVATVLDVGARKFRYRRRTWVAVTSAPFTFAASAVMANLVVVSAAVGVVVRRSSAPKSPSTGEVARQTAAHILRRDVDVEVNGKRFAVRVWVPETSSAHAATDTARSRPARAAAAASSATGGSGQVTVPMQGTIVKVLVAIGDAVEAGDAVCVLEAMKMENNITAERSGTVSDVKVAEGDTVGAGDVVVVIG